MAHTQNCMQSIYFQQARYAHLHTALRSGFCFKTLMYAKRDVCKPWKQLVANETLPELSEFVTVKTNKIYSNRYSDRYYSDGYKTVYLSKVFTANPHTRSARRKTPSGGLGFDREDTSPTPVADQTYWESSTKRVAQHLVLRQTQTHQTNTHAKHNQHAIHRYLIPARLHRPISHAIQCKHKCPRADFPTILARAKRQCCKRAQRLQETLLLYRQSEHRNHIFGSHTKRKDIIQET